jgi:cytochrome P450
VDSDTFRSANGIALNEPANQAILGCTLASDGDLHAQLRKVVAHRLTPRALRPMRELVTERADELVAGLVQRGSFDAVSDLARALPLSIVPDFIGWPQEGREHLLEWAGANFDSFGPMNERAQRAMPKCGEMAAYGAEIVRTGNVLPGSLGAGVLEARDQGEVTTEQCMMLMLDYLAPSLDTTISAVGSAVWLFAQHPDQWHLVRSDPGLIPNAVNEVVRFESPIRAFGRLAENDTEIGGVPIPAGSRVLVIYASANRDERKFERPDEFDVTRRDAVHQLGFGIGEHGCAGQGLARMETESLLAALARSVTRFHVGTPERALNNLIRAFGTLPVTVETGA